jgi:Flp pilus assembly pilin Flp
VITWDALLIAVAIIAAAAILSNTIDNVVSDFAEELFERWDAMDDED